MLAPVLVPRSQYDRRGRVGIGSDPCTVLNEEHEEEDRNADDDESAVKSSNSRGLVFLQDGSEDLESWAKILDGSRLGSFGGRCLILLGLLGGYFRAGSASGGDRTAPGGRCISGVRRPWVDIDVQNSRKRNRGSDTDTRSESQHQPNHDAGEVCSYEGVDDNEHMLVPEFPEAKDDTRWEEEYEELEVHEE